MAKKRVLSSDWVSRVIPPKKNLSLTGALTDYSDLELVVDRHNHTPEIKLHFSKKDNNGVVKGQVSIKITHEGQHVHVKFSQGFSFPQSSLLEEHIGHARRSGERTFVLLSPLTEVLCTVPKK